MIYLSLLAIASDPGLWDYHNEDNLIFTRSDYADPLSSEVFGRLKKSPDVTVARLAERIEECCALPVDKVPDLETALQGIPPSAAVPPPMAFSTTVPPTPAAPLTTAPTFRPTPIEQQPAPVVRRVSPAPLVPPAPTPATPTPVPQSLSRSMSSLVSKVATLWLKLLLAGMGAMFAGWMIHTDVFLSLVNLILLITGIVAVLIFIGTKHPTALVVGVVTLAVRFLNLLDWAVSTVWTWIIIAGLAAVIVGGAARMVTHKGVFGKSALAAVLLLASLWSFVVVTGFDVSSNFEALLGAQSVPRSTSTPVPPAPPPAPAPVPAPATTLPNTSSSPSSTTTPPIATATPVTTPSAISPTTGVNGGEERPPPQLH